MAPPPLTSSRNLDVSGHQKRREGEMLEREVVGAGRPARRLADVLKVGGTSK